MTRLSTSTCQSGAGGGLATKDWSTRAAAIPRAASAWLQLTKARLSLLVLLTTAVGYVLGSESSYPFLGGRLLWTLLGTALAAGCANALNQVIEVRRDAVMYRTRRRPLPAKIVTRGRTTVIAVALGAAGVTVLALAVNTAAASLAALTILLYVLAYTLLKTLSTLNTLVGAVCGAIPPMIGWAAATGRLEAGAWALAALLFVWQVPHFLALAWLYREDYARGRFRMLPALDPGGRLTCRIVVLTCLLLVPVTLSTALIGVAGWRFALGSLLLGTALAVLAVRLYRRRTDARARHVFLASIAYLTAILLLLVADRGPGLGG